MVHSTEKAFCHCIEKIFKTVDSGKFGSAIFIYLQKAFDTVDREILLSKLSFYGIRGIFLEWFRSFYRMQSVTVSGSKSKLKRIVHGVPQGSVMINDLSNAIAYLDHDIKIKINGHRLHPSIQVKL